MVIYIMPPFQPAKTYVSEYPVMKRYDKNIAKDKWAKANMGNTKIENFKIFEGDKIGVPPNDGYPARLPPLYYQKY
jgi:hypothetical protein